MGHWRMLEPGTTRVNAYARIRREKKANPKRKYRVSKHKGKATYGSRTSITFYVPEVWYK